MKNKLVELISKINLQYQHKQIEELYPELYSWINESTEQYNPKSLIESIYIILNSPAERQCQYNTNINKKFISFSKGYSKFCVNECQCLKDFKQRKLGELSDDENRVRKSKRKLTNLERYGVENPAQLNEFKEKTKQTSLEKYGVENVSMLPEIRKKAIETHIDRYGISSMIGTEEVQTKIKQTNLEKLGVEFPMQSIEIRDKSKQTNLARYGVENPQQLANVREKSRQTNLERYGTKHPTQVNEIKEKIKQTNLDRHGVEYPAQSSVLKEKARQTNLERYGVENPSQSSEIKEKVKKTNLELHGCEYIGQRYISNSTMDILKDKQLFIEVITGKTIKEVCTELSISVTTVLVYSRKYEVYNLLNTSSSSYELIIENLLTELNIEHIRNDRTIIKPLELDFYIPKYNLAIEVGSTYFHSELSGNKDKFYHYNKWKMCKDQNITLLQYFDTDLFNNWHIIESKIKRLSTIPAPVIGARKLQLSNLSDYAIESKFLAANHLQGPTSKRNVVISAYYNNELVAVSSWLVKDDITELVRYATNINYSYPGLFSRMLSRFKLITNFKGKLISFSDNRHSNGNLYKASGFNLEYTSEPGYSYSTNGYTLESRLKYQKHKLKKIFGLDDNYINSHTEWEIMQEMGYDRLWDAGQSLWLMTI